MKRYTGDVLHFGMAQSGAHDDNAEFLIVGDDVAVGRTQGSIVGRRGLAGTTLVYKVAGYAAAQGADLAEVKRLAELVAENCGTIGSSFAHCHVPGTAKGESALADGEVEIGMGIHNEPGFSKVKQQTKDQLIDSMVELITSTTDKERSFVSWKGKGDQAVLMLNNLGGLSELELVGLLPNIFAAFAKRNIEIVRLFVGTFMSSLDMPGFSITALRLPETDVDTILKGIDVPSSAPGWRPASKPVSQPQATPQPKNDDKKAKPSGLTAPKAFTAAIEQGCKNVIAAEPDITRYDVIAGDGDCGLTLKAGGEAVLKGISSGVITSDDVVNSIRAVSEIVERDMGGTSGALYAIFFSGLAKALDGQTGEITPQAWAEAAKKAVDVLFTYTSARPPSRTLVDPLVAFVDALPQGLDAAAKQAKDAALNTAKLAAGAGRAAYVDQETLKKEDVPDPGAWGLALLFEGFASAAK